MTTDLGPVQFVAIGFDAPKFGGGIASELRRLKQQGIVRVIDALVVFKDNDGNVRKMQVTELDLENTRAMGDKIAGLIGAELAEPGESGASPAYDRALPQDEPRDQNGNIFYGDEWDVLESIPNNTAAALMLLEHQWAIPLRKAVIEEGAMAVGDLWLQRNDLVAVGLLPGQTDNGQ